MFLRNKLRQVHLRRNIRIKRGLEEPEKESTQLSYVKFFYLFISVNAKSSGNPSVSSMFM